MRAVLVIEYESSMKEIVGILAENGYKVSAEKTGNYWEHKYKIEVSKDEGNTID